MLLENRKLICVGGGSGIAAAAARAWVREGAQVTILDVDSESGKAQADALGDAASFIECDVADRDNVFDAIDEAVKSMGGLNGTINTAGNHEFIPAHEITVEQWERMFGSHVLGTMYVNQAAFPYLKEKGGRIINTGSGASERGQMVLGTQYNALYASAKGAVQSWTRGIAREWGKYDITANVVSPAMKTKLWKQSQSEVVDSNRAQRDAEFKKLMPIDGEFGDPDRDFAPVSLFLISDMSRFITGRTIVVDGGLT
jgi:NAD(P)-dependent dehydrogenase (short-subunit alcohol dehydrogenase family)